MINKPKPSHPWKKSFPFSPKKKKDIVDYEAIKRDKIDYVFKQKQWGCGIPKLPKRMVKK